MNPLLRPKGFNYRVINRWETRAKKLLYSYQQGKCFYCDIELLPIWHRQKKPTDTYPTLEHLRPRFSSQHQRDFRLSNLVVACYKCNKEKGGNDWTEFYMSKNPIKSTLYTIHK